MVGEKPDDSGCLRTYERSTPTQQLTKANTPPPMPALHQACVSHPKFFDGNPACQIDTLIVGGKFLSKVAWQYTRRVSDAANKTLHVAYAFLVAVRAFVPLPENHGGHQSGFGPLDLRLVVRVRDSELSD